MYISPVIPIGEIEHALSQINGIKQNCVIAKEKKTENNNTKYVVGYYVLDNNKHKPEKETLPVFIKSDLLQSAVIRQFEIIGEAGSKISVTTQSAYQNIE